MKKIFCVFLLILFMAPLSLHAQNLNDQAQSPKTKLEQFVATQGAVIVRGYDEIGSAKGLYKTSINVEADEYTNVSTARKEYGITVEVTGSDKKKDTSYIDYDEIESLIKGIDYLANVDKSTTGFSKFEADYTTRGDLRISTFTMQDKILFAVTSGSSGSVSAYYELSSLPEIRALFQRAKAKIDSSKGK